jgi:hypothetical protein
MLKLILMYVDSANSRYSNRASRVVITYHHNIVIFTFFLVVFCETVNNIKSFILLVVINAGLNQKHVIQEIYRI